MAYSYPDPNWRCTAQVDWKPGDPPNVKRPVCGRSDPHEHLVYAPCYGNDGEADWLAVSRPVGPPLIWVYTPWEQLVRRFRNELSFRRRQLADKLEGVAELSFRRRQLADKLEGVAEWLRDWDDEYRYNRRDD